MKKIGACYFLVFVSLISSVWSQDRDEEERKEGFKKENLFTGRKCNAFIF